MLTVSNVDRLVDNEIGVYLLRNSHGGPVRYVGMSTHLARRLKQHRGEYQYFSFEHLRSESMAYRRETRLYHYYGGTEQLDNERHPPRPHKQVTCPACDIHE